MKDQTKFPLWFTILTWALVLSNLLVFGLFSLVHPELPWPDLGNTEAAFPIQFFAIRHLAFGVVLLHAMIRKNKEVLKALYHIFLIISVLDVALLAFNGYYIPAMVNLIGEVSTLVTVLIGAGLFIIPMSIAVRYLRK